jgi:hypothetical protein
VFFRLGAMKPSLHFVVFHLIRLVLRATLLLLIVSFSAFSQPGFVEIRGEIELINYAQRDQKGMPVEKRRSYQFTCIVGTNGWRIDSNFIRNAKMAYYYDGTNVYQGIQVTAPPLRPLKPRRGVRIAEVPFDEAKSNQTINVYPSAGGHPMGNVGVNMPWLAFCSGSYLRIPDRPMPLPTAVISVTPDAFGCLDKTEVFDDSFGLPRHIELLTSKSQFERGIWNERLPRYESIERMRRNPRFPFEDGIKRFSYVCNESTNFHGWTFPSKFNYVTYVPRKKGAWEKFVEGNGTLISIRETTAPKNVFEPDLPKTITDHRFRHETKLVDAIVYRSTNSILAPPDDPQLQDVFKRKVMHARVDVYHRARKTSCVAGLLLLVVGGGPIALMFSHYIRNKSKTIKTEQEK